MTPATLGQYFRSFLVKLSMIESQLVPMDVGGTSGSSMFAFVLAFISYLDDVSFAILIELKDDAAPTPSKNEEPPPWLPADNQHTTSGTSDEAELHLIRAVSTGIVNVSHGDYLAPAFSHSPLALICSSGIRSQA